MRNLVLCFLLALTPTISGCGCVNWFAYVLAPPAPTRTVKAVYPGLTKKTVAIAVYVDLETLLDYQTVQLDISDAVAAQLRRHVKRTNVVNPLQVIRYQDENPRWYATPPEKLCRALNADCLLLISLMEFSTRAPGAIHLARGRITGEASLYLADRAGTESSDQPAWQSELIRVLYPRESTLGIPARDDRDIRLQTAKIFADMVVKNFYDHKVPREK